MHKYSFWLTLTSIFLSSLSFSQNFNQLGITPKLNASINNPALMGALNTTQVSGNYIMGYQPNNHGVIQQHTYNLNLNGRVNGARTSIGGGARIEKTYSNDYESAIDASSIWLSIGYRWGFKNHTYLGLGLTIGHQFNNNQNFTSFAPGLSGARYFFPTDKDDQETLIGNLGLSYFGNNFFVSLSNTGLTGMYDFTINTRSTLSPFGGISRLNYYGQLSYGYYVGLELDLEFPISIGASWSNNFNGSTNELNSINSYISYSYKKVNLAYSISNNQVYFEKYGNYQDRGWVNSFTLSYLVL